MGSLAQHEYNLLFSTPGEKKMERNLKCDIKTSGIRHLRTQELQSTDSFDFFFPIIIFFLHCVYKVIGIHNFLIVVLKSIVDGRGQLYAT